MLNDSLDMKFYKGDNYSDKKWMSGLPGLGEINYYKEAQEKFLRVIFF